MKTKSGTSLVKKFRAQAEKNGQSMYIGKVWPGEGAGNYSFQVGSYGIWLYSHGEFTKAHPPVAEAASLDELHGR